MIQIPLDLLEGMIEHVEIPLTSGAKSMSSHIPTVMPEHSFQMFCHQQGWESPNKLQNFPERLRKHWGSQLVLNSVLL